MNKEEKKECVAAILSEKEIIINIGRNKKVEIGDCFHITDKDNGTLVTDPYTGEKLGVIPSVKYEIEVTKVYDKMSVCKIYNKRNPLNAINKNPMTMNRTFNYSGIPIIANQVKSNSEVRIGDLIERV
ncbi:hypothetical protein [Macrococcoides caseolyticum]|nr:hypothetical protein [Macrococcus caseolyticus]